MDRTWNDSEDGHANMSSQCDVLEIKQQVIDLVFHVRATSDKCMFLFKDNCFLMQ